MKQILEFIPLVLFFAVYQMDGKTLTVGEYSHTVDGIFSATGVLMVATVVQVVATWLLTRELDKRLLWTSAAVLAFGGATLLLRNELFIQWKPSVFNWAMALAFAGSQFIGERNLLERLLGTQIQLPKEVWQRVCWVWVVHFTVVGALNIIVAYQFEEATWVSYKLWSSIGFTLFIMVITGVMISPWLKEADAAKNTDRSTRP